VTEDFVTAAKLRGESAWSIAARELLPNVLASVLVEFSLRTGYAVLFIGGLSFLGFGAAPPTPDWGLMINEGRQYLASALWPVLGPSLALASLVVALSLFTEGLGEFFGLSTQRGRSR
jgi:peptide/nickel transport system permease protein